MLSHSYSLSRSGRVEEDFLISILHKLRQLFSIKTVRERIAVLLSPTCRRLGICSKMLFHSTTRRQSIVDIAKSQITFFSFSEISVYYFFSWVWNFSRLRSEVFHHQKKNYCSRIDSRAKNGKLIESRRICWLGELIGVLCALFLEIQSALHSYFWTDDPMLI